MGLHSCIRLVVAGLLAVTPLRASAAVDYNRDVRPILSDHCYTCHGPDASRRKAGLRLDRRQDALLESEPGVAAVVPGSRSRSLLFQRIKAGGAEQMPPAGSGKQLTAAQVELLGRWIDEGARWDDHWAYVAPRRPPLPLVSDRTWQRNPIDHFVLARLETEGLRPSPEADRPTLIRRLSLDLTGLPPSPAEVDAFIADPTPDAYEKVVERLLASPHFGERLAQQWLDLARYADTNGFRLDNHRDMWRYRDWVIAAFNRNLPFDRFTVEELAGARLPGATVGQKISTGFHRNTMVNFGNGSDPKEYHAKAVMDRVATTATVWLGTTLSCAQCHDHKYDPFTQKDFYRLYAFFNNVPEKGLDGERRNPVPVLLLPSPEQARRLAEIRAARAGKDSDRLRAEEEALLDAIPSTPVMEEMASPRVTRVFKRGDYLNEGEVVTAGVPASLPALPPGAPANRLGLARWLVDPANPLTARVTVNRWWAMLFGTGLVKTADDFGAQGEPPSHPELLDWLAVEFVAKGWDVKALLRQIVTSATYRQSSHVRAALLERDPENRLLARGARFRLDAETVRDNALAAGGLLARGVGGPSVRPYQPPGLWEQVAVGKGYSSQSYAQDRGPDLYRRGLYTYWKRSMPPPALTAFDAPTRELCTASRPRTNTPLQALVLMNDPTFVEAGRALAQRALREGGLDSQGKLRYLFRLGTSRYPTPAELHILSEVHGQQEANYRRRPRDAAALVRVGELPVPPDLDVRDLAAWTATASLVLNLDETITRE
jgi:mono/diheme cytochrome c family protein